MFKVIDCNCIIESYETFFTTGFSITVLLQNEFITYYREHFNENIRKTSCPTCIMRRLDKIRNDIKIKVNHERTKSSFD